MHHSQPPSGILRCLLSLEQVLGIVLEALAGLALAPSFVEQADCARFSAQEARGVPSLHPGTWPLHGQRDEIVRQKVRRLLGWRLPRWTWKLSETHISGFRTALFLLACKSFRAYCALTCLCFVQAECRMFGFRPRMKHAMISAGLGRDQQRQLRVSSDPIGWKLRWYTT